MSERNWGEFARNHKRQEIALGFVLFAASASAAGVYAYRRSQPADETEIAPVPVDPNVAQYKKRATIFEDERLPSETRQVMARAGALIYNATLTSEEGIIRLTTLMDQLGRSHDNLQTALSYLQDKTQALDIALVGRRPSLTQKRAIGYYATPALEWAITQGEYPVVQEAVAELRTEGLFQALPDAD